ncbi:MAG TPA: lamin tail domain-containing protein, partial [Candidatus Acidoferrum sp.]|nr:lamin tail domain-containing protein [Candidatus Acidoferrum sp.]
MKPFRVPVWKYLLVCFLGLLASGARAGVQITEFMYQPASFNTNEEWIEIWNNDTNAVNIQGWRFSSGVNFTFSNSLVLAPGAYLVIAANSNVFAANYTAVAGAGKVIGNWRGTLRNNGDTILLEDALGEKVDEVTFAPEGDWAFRIRGPLQAGFRGWDWYAPHDGTDKSVELINPIIKKNSGQNWAASIPKDGTPGAANSVLSTNTGAVILDVAHAPLVPASTNNITISAEIVDPNAAGTVVRLRWRLDANPQAASFSSTNMFDDGAHGDGVAGDRIYGVILPPHANLTIVEFYVEAVTVTGKISTWPAPVLAAFDGAGPTGQVANALFQVDNTPYSGLHPLYRILMTAAEKAERDAIASAGNQTDAQMNATLITIEGGGNELRYLCGMRPRGAGSRGSSTGRAVPNQRVNVPADKTWKGVRAFNLNSQYTHSQIAGYALASRAGLTTESARAVKVKINGVDNANPGPPQYGHYSHTEAPNSDFVDAHFPEDGGGNLYRMSTGSHGAQLSYRGSAFTSYINNGYIKQNNNSENDWNDLINLTSVLTFAPDETYVEDVRQVANVEEWMLFFATFTLNESEETSFATGRGDDYSAYRGSIDPRFMLLAHDWDTILGQGDSTGNLTDNLFRMVPAVTGDTHAGAAVILNRFMLHPEFAPIYYATLKHMLETSYSNEQVSRTLDEVLGGWVPGPVVTAMKTFSANRNAYVRSQIPTNITVSSSLPTVSGFPRTTLSTATLFGRADAVRTRSILVNGSPANWIAWQARWTNTIALQPGINRILVQSLDTNGVEFARTNYDVWFDTGASTSVSGALATDTTWTAASGPYLVTANLTVPAGRTLTIEPGTTVELNPGVTITVNGRLLAEGTDTSRIRFARVPGDSNWGSLDFLGTGAIESRLAYADFTGCAGTTINGRAAQMHVNSSRIFIDHCTWANTPSQTYLAFDASSFVVQNSLFPTFAFSPGAPTMLYGTNGIPAGGHGIFRDNLFGRTYETSDTIDFSGGNRPAPIVQFIGNVFDGAGDEQLNLNSADAWIEGNIFIHVHRDATRIDDPFDTASAISGSVSVTGQYSEWTIINNLFYDIDHAVLAKQGNRFTFVNNTVAHVAKSSGSGQLADIAAFNFN